MVIICRCPNGCVQPTRRRPTPVSTHTVQHPPARMSPPRHSIFHHVGIRRRLSVLNFPDRRKIALPRPSPARSLRPGPLARRSLDPRRRRPGRPRGFTSSKIPTNGSPSCKIGYPQATRGQTDGAQSSVPGGRAEFSRPVAPFVYEIIQKLFARAPSTPAISPPKRPRSRSSGDGSPVWRTHTMLPASAIPNARRQWRAAFPLRFRHVGHLRRGDCYPGHLDLLSASSGCGDFFYVPVF